MKLKVRTRLIIVVMALWACGQFAMAKQGAAQERIKIAYSADNSTNVIWYSALDTGIYKKYVLDSKSESSTWSKVKARESTYNCHRLKRNVNMLGRMGRENDASV